MSTPDGLAAEAARRSAEQLAPASGVEGLVERWKRARRPRGRPRRVAGRLPGRRVTGRRIFEALGGVPAAPGVVPVLWPRPPLALATRLRLHALR